MTVLVEMIVDRGVSGSKPLQGLDVSGTVVGLRAVTTGGVVEPGVPLMEIVPADDPLIVEARVKPADIDVARPVRPVRLPFDRAPSHRFR